MHANNQSTMRAVVVQETGPIESHRVRDIEIPKARAESVTIAVHAAGVNFPDILMAEGKYQRRPKTPFVPGLELAGVVTKSNASQFSPGDRVAAFPAGGAFAEVAVVDAPLVFPIPDAVNFADAAASVVTYGTAYHALTDRAGLSQEETILILGATGGVGLAALDLTRMLKLTAIAAVSTDDKAQLARTYGADHVVNYRNTNLGDWLKERFPTGVDAVLDPVGGPASEQSLRRLAIGGQLIVIGFASGEIPSIPLNLPLLKECQVVGVHWGAHARRNTARNAEQIGTLFDRIASGALRPRIDREIPLGDFVDALAHLRNRAALGKVVLRIRD